MELSAKQKGKGSKSTETAHPNDMVSVRNFQATNSFKFPQSIAKNSYTVKRFFTETSNPKTYMTPVQRYEDETQPSVTGVICIPATVEGEDGKMTRAAKTVLANAKEEFTRTCPSVIYRATETIIEESGGKLKMSDTLSISFAELHLWAPLQHPEEWLEIVKNKTGNFHRHVFTAPFRSSPTAKHTLVRFVTLSHIRTATAAVASQEKIFGSMTSAKIGAANREAALKYYEAADTMNENSRRHVHQCDIDIEVNRATARTKAELADVQRKLAEANHVAGRANSLTAYPRAFARLKQMLIFSHDKPINLGKELYHMFIDMWNDPNILALERQLPAVVLVTPPTHQQKGPGMATTATSSAYAAAQPVRR